jgi:Arm DNA-binding domain
MAEKVLSTRMCDTAKPKSKPYVLTDSGGSSLRVMPSSAKYWQYRYRLGGKENTLQIGRYPEIGLEKARKELDKHRAVVQAGSDPITERRLRRARVAKATADTLAAMADEWIGHRKPFVAAATIERDEGISRRVRPIRRGTETGLCARDAARAGPSTDGAGQGDRENATSGKTNMCPKRFIDPWISDAILIVWSQRQKRTSLVSRLALASDV